jgi:hypothetical protein
VGLNVWMLDPWAAPEESPCLQVRRGGGPGLAEEPLYADTKHAQPLLVRVEGDGSGALLGHVQLQVVLQVGPHPGQVVDRFNPNLQCHC